MSGTLTSNPASTVVDKQTIINYGMLVDILNAVFAAIGTGSQTPTTPAEVLDNLGGTTIGQQIFKAADAAAVNALLGASGVVSAVAVGIATLTTSAFTTVGVSPPLNFTGTSAGDFTGTTVSVTLTPANASAQSYVATNGPIYVNNIIPGLGGLNFTMNPTATPAGTEQFYVTVIGV